MDEASLSRCIWALAQGHIYNWKRRSRLEITAEEAAELVSDGLVEWGGPQGEHVRLSADGRRKFHKLFDRKA